MDLPPIEELTSLTSIHSPDLPLRFCQHYASPVTPPHTHTHTHTLSCPTNQIPLIHPAPVVGSNSLDRGHPACRRLRGRYSQSGREAVLVVYLSLCLSLIAQPPLSVFTLSVTIVSRTEGQPGQEAAMCYSALSSECSGCKSPESSTTARATCSVQCAWETACEPCEQNQFARGLSPDGFCRCCWRRFEF